MTLLFKILKKRFFLLLFVWPLFFELKADECRDAFLSLNKKKNTPVRVGINNGEYAQYIIKQGDNKIISYFYDKKNIPDDALGERGIYYHPEVHEVVKSFFSYFTERAITMEEAEELFDEALILEEIAWDDVLSGCNQRSHLMARKFESLGVYVDKAWLRGDLFIKKFEEMYIKWNFHVAPLVYVKSLTGKITRMVIDPSIFGRPISIDRWVDRLNFYRKEVVKTFYPNPFNSMKSNKLSLAISNSDAFDIVIHHPYLSEEDKLLLCSEYMNKLRKDKDEVNNKHKLSWDD